MKKILSLMLALAMVFSIYTPVLAQEIQPAAEAAPVQTAQEAPAETAVPEAPAESTPAEQPAASVPESAPAESAAESTPESTPAESVPAEQPAESVAESVPVSDGEQPASSQSTDIYVGEQLSDAEAPQEEPTGEITLEIVATPDDMGETIENGVTDFASIPSPMWAMSANLTPDPNFTTFREMFKGVKLDAGDITFNNFGDLVVQAYDAVLADLNSPDSIIFNKAAPYDEDAEGVAEYIEYVSFINPGFNQEILEGLARYIALCACYAVNFDTNKLFFMGEEVAYKVTVSGYDTVTFSLMPYALSEIGTVELRTDYANRMDAVATAVAQEANNTYENDFEKVAFINNWLCENNETGGVVFSYSALPYTPMSALLSGTDSSIPAPYGRGYASGLKMLLDYAGIQNALVWGGDEYFWNNVKIDGKWYGVDAAYNNILPNIRTDYLLTTDLNNLDDDHMVRQFVTARIPSTYPQLAESNEITAVGLNTHALKLETGETAVLTSYLLPGNAADQTIKWTSSDENVAIVNDGKVIAVRKGTVTVTAEAANGMQTQCTVTVTGSGVQINKANFPDTIFRLTVSEFDTNENGFLSDEELEAVETLAVSIKKSSSLENVYTLKGIEYFTELKRLMVADARMTELDLTQNPKLETVVAFYSDFTKIKTGSSTLLKNLYCSSNALETLDVSGLPNLEILECGGNKLTSIDVSGNKELTELSVSGNALTSLDVSGLTKLTKLDCSDNELTAIDVTNNTLLEELTCRGNNLGALDVSNNKELTTLYCANDNLTSLDVSNNTKLTILYCQDNKLTSIDVTSCRDLLWFSCSKNSLTSLDVTKNTALTTLDFSSNKLKYVNIYENKELEKLYCGNNNLVEIDTKYATKLKTFSCANQQITAEAAGLNFNGTAWTYNLAVGVDGNIGYVPAEVASPLTYDVLSSTVTFPVGFEDDSFEYDVYTYNDTVKYMKVTVTGLNAIKGEEILIDENNFPDANFRKYITDNFDTNSSGTLSYSERSAVTSMDVHFKNIKSLKGTEYFQGLTTLDCSANSLTQLNLEQNLALEHIDCSYNNLTYLEFSLHQNIKWLDCSNNSLTELYVSRSYDLEYFNCSDNNLAVLYSGYFKKLKELDCSDNELTALNIIDSRSLEILDCSNNKITDINLLNNYTLKSVDCSNNALTKLKIPYSQQLESLVCSDNEIEQLETGSLGALTTLECANNHISTLDVSGSPLLTKLVCGNNNITLLDVSQAKDLRILKCGSNKISELAVGNLTQLKTLKCTNNNIAMLDLSSNTNLKKAGSESIQTDIAVANAITEADGKLQYNLAMHLGTDVLQNVTVTGYEYDAATGIVTLDEGETQFTYQYDTNNAEYPIMQVTITDIDIAKAGGVAINYVNFPDSYFRDYIKKAFDKDQNGYLSEEEIANVTKMILSPVRYESVASTMSAYDETIVGGGQVTLLDGIQYFTNLEELYCEQMKITGVDLSQNTKLNTLALSAADITSLDLSANTKLKRLDVSGTKLTSLDLSKNTELTIFSSKLTPLTSIDLSTNTKLERLLVEDTALTSLDVSKNTELTVLYCANTQLTSLDVNKNTKLAELDCSNIKLESLDLSKNTALTDLTCTGTGLTTIDVSNNSALKYLDCSDNNLTSLDISACTALINLECNNNSLEALDLSGNPALYYLRAAKNKLTTIKLSEEIESADLSENNLTSIEANDLLWSLDASDNKLTSIDLSRCTDIRYVTLTNNNLTSLDVTANTGLTKLKVDNNKIAALDLSQNTKLKANGNFDGEITDAIAAAVTLDDGVLTYNLAKNVGAENIANVSVADPLIYDAATGIVTLGKDYDADGFTYTYTTGSEYYPTMEVQLAGLTAATLPVEEVTLNKTEISLMKGAQTTLKATVKPYNAADKTVTWTSSDTDVATVNGGKITAVKEGTATVTAEAGGKKAVCTVTVTSGTSVADFVERLYTQALGRESDEAGKKYWVDMLGTNALSGAEALRGFVLSDELTARKLTDSDFVNMLYKTALNREADETGATGWLKLLNNGLSREYVVCGFARSEEFAQICKTYGVTCGEIKTTQPRDRAPQLTEFVNRLYSKLLGRQGEEAGLNHWCTLILQEISTPQAVAESFVASPEFASKNYTDEQFTEYMYNAFLGRASDANGKAYWISKLKAGDTRAEIAHQFAISPEFTEIVKSFSL